MYQYDKNISVKAPSSFTLCGNFVSFSIKTLKLQNTRNNAVVIKFLSKSYTADIKTESLGPSTILPPLYGRGTWYFLPGQNTDWPVQQQHTYKIILNLGRGSERRKNSR